MEQPVSPCADLADTRVELALGLLSGTDQGDRRLPPGLVPDVPGGGRRPARGWSTSSRCSHPRSNRPRASRPVCWRRWSTAGWSRRGRRVPDAFRAGRMIGGRAAAVVAVGLVALGLVLGFAADRTGDHEPAEQGLIPPVKTALAVSPSGRTTCRVMVTGTNPATVLVSLDGSPGASGAYAVAVQQVDGPTIELGTLQLADGHGVLARSVPVRRGHADDDADVRGGRQGALRGAPHRPGRDVPSPVAIGR